MNPLKSWLGISTLETRIRGADDAINQAFLHIEELRGHIEKLSELVLNLSKISLEKPKEKPKKKVKKDGK